MEDNFEKTGMHQDAKKELFQFARELRERATQAEKVLWEELRMKKLDGFKFRRQHPIGIYILDFYCHNRKLAVELDGKYHLNKDQIKYDIIRTSHLNEVGIKEIRFKNEEVLNDLENVLGKIRNSLHEE